MSDINIQPADRISSVKEYYFTKKLKEIAELNAKGKNIVSLGIGSPDMPPAEETINTLCKEVVKPDMHGYPTFVGIPELREGFANWYKEWFDIDLNPATEIQPLIGSKEGILQISMVFLNPGDGVLIPNPGYPLYTSVSNMMQADTSYYDLNETDWQPDFDTLEKQDLSKVKLMWVNYPNMPTGAKGSKELFEKLVRFAKKHQIVIVNDNPYSLILNNEPLSIFSVEGAKDICIELNSLSKSHNLAGWRIGMLATNTQFIKWVQQVKSNIDSGIFKPVQLAVIDALKTSKEWHKKMNYDLYASRRVVAEKIMNQLGCTYNKDQVGMFLWGKIPSDYKGSEELADKVLYEANVFITPGFIFGSNGERYIRISLCAKEEILSEALERIKTLK